MSRLEKRMMLHFRGSPSRRCPGDGAGLPANAASRWPPSGTLCPTSFLARGRQGQGPLWPKRWGCAGGAHRPGLSPATRPPRRSARPAPGPGTCAHPRSETHSPRVFGPEKLCFEGALSLQAQERRPGDERRREGPSAHLGWGRSQAPVSCRLHQGRRGPSGCAPRRRWLCVRASAGIGAGARRGHLGARVPGREGARGGRADPRPGRGCGVAGLSAGPRPQGKGRGMGQGSA